MWQSKSRLIYSMRWISFILWGGFICRECLNRWMTWNTFTTFTTPGFIQRRNQVTQQLHCSLKGWAAYHNVRCWVISRLLCAARCWNSWKLPASEQMKTWIWIHDCWRLFPVVGLYFPITYNHWRCNLDFGLFGELHEQLYQYETKGLASYCKAETTFTFHFSVISALESI